MFKYCPRCGNGLVRKMVKGQQRSLCLNCGYIHWNVEKISVGGIVTKKKRILLVQRSNNPGKGRWTIPGGFVEQTETLSMAIQREINEETGIISRANKLTAVAELPNPKQHDIYLTFQLDYCGGEIKCQPDEVCAAAFFSLDEAQKLPLADLTRQLLEHYFRGGHAFIAMKISPQDANGFYLYM